jgi:hypothetical protein
MWECGVTNAILDVEVLGLLLEPLKMGEEPVHELVRDGVVLGICYDGRSAHEVGGLDVLGGRIVGSDAEAGGGGGEGARSGGDEGRTRERQPRGAEDCDSGGAGGLESSGGGPSGPNQMLAGHHGTNWMWGAGCCPGNPVVYL